MTEEFIDDIIAGLPAEPVPADSTVAAPVGAELAPSQEPTLAEPTAQPVAEPTPAPAEPTSDAKPAKSAPEALVPTEHAPANEAVEALAKQIGWNPDATQPGFVDAATYILRSREIQDSMKTTNRELKAQLTNLQGSVDALQAHNKNVYQAEISRLKTQLSDLQVKKKAAVELADVDTVNALDAQIDEVKGAMNQPEPATPQPSANPIYDEWVKDNQWYLTDQAMASYADTVAQQYAGAPLDRLYPLVRQKVAEVFPEKFQSPTPSPVPTPTPTLANPNPGQIPVPVSAPTKPAPVGPTSPVEATTSGNAKPTFTEADLTSDQQSIMKQFVGAGIMTKQQYINDIAKLQEA